MNYRKPNQNYGRSIINYRHHEINDYPSKLITPRSQLTDTVDTTTLLGVYDWVDSIPLSRPRKHLGRDFSDGVLMAEIISHFFPLYIDLHNYVPSNRKAQKKENWTLLRDKVLVKKLNMVISDDTIEDLISGDNSTVEQLLMTVKSRIDNRMMHNREDKDLLLLHQNKQEIQQKHKQAGWITREQGQQKASNETQRIGYDGIGLANRSKGNEERTPEMKGKKILRTLNDTVVNRMMDEDYPCELWNTEIRHQEKQRQESREMKLQQQIQLLTKKTETLEKLIELKNIKISSLSCQIMKQASSVAPRNRRVWNVDRIMNDDEWRDNLR